jgi:hypothetical protein
MPNWVNQCYTSKSSRMNRQKVVLHRARATPLTRNQVELMGQDNVSELEAPGFAALQISPKPIEIMLSG